MPSLFKRLNKNRGFSGLLGLVLIFAPVGCKKKDRLSASTFNLVITPNTASALKNSSVTESITLTARGTSNGATVAVNPTWTISGADPSTLSPAIGTTVVFTPTALGDVVIYATFDGVIGEARIAVVAYKAVPNPTDQFDVYTDRGLPAGSDVSSDIFASCGTNFVLSEISSGYTPEGIRYQRGTGANTNDFWGVTLDKSTVSGLPCGVSGPTAGKSKDLSAFAAGNLVFFLRLDAAAPVGAIRIELTDTSGAVPFTLVSNSNGYQRTNTDWQQITIPIASFPGLDLTQMKVPFAMVTLTGPMSFDVDAIRWEK